MMKVWYEVNWENNEEVKTATRKAYSEALELAEEIAEDTANRNVIVSEIQKTGLLFPIVAKCDLTGFNLGK